MTKARAIKSGSMEWYISITYLFIRSIPYVIKMMLSEYEVNHA